VQAHATSDQPNLSDELEAWLNGEGEKTLGSLIHLFGRRSFAVVFVVLMALPALPLPTGGATHVFEIVVVLIALQLIAGRNEIWLPERWRRIELTGERRQRLLNALIRLIRRLERISRRRVGFLFAHRLSNIVFGLLVIVMTVGAFVAPPFSGLDTLPALGVVLLSLGVLLEDVLIVLAALVVGAAGITVEFVLGRAAFHYIWKFF
jgi:hypothetical protein